MKNDELVSLLNKCAFLALPRLIEEELIYPDKTNTASSAPVSSETIAMIDWYNRARQTICEEKQDIFEESEVFSRLKNRIEAFATQILPLLLLDGDEKKIILETLKSIDQCEENYQQYKKISREMLTTNDKKSVHLYEKKAFYEIRNIHSHIKELNKQLSQKISAPELFPRELPKYAAHLAATEILEKGFSIIKPGKRIRKKEARTVPGLTLCIRSFWVDQENVFLIDTGSKLHSMPHGSFSKGKNAFFCHRDETKISIRRIFLKTSANTPNALKLAKQEKRVLEKLNLSLGGGERTSADEEKLHSSFDQFEERIEKFELAKYLFDRLRTKTAWQIKDLAYILKGCAAQIDYLHGYNILHRDIKLDNIMYNDEEKSVKVFDFGLSIDFDSPENSELQMKDAIAVWAYAAPEIREDLIARNKDPLLLNTPMQFSTATDIYSLGIVFGLLCGFLQIDETANVVPSTAYSYLLESLDKTSCYNIYNLFLSMTQADPTKRADMHEILFSLENIPAFVLLPPINSHQDSLWSGKTIGKD